MKDRQNLESLLNQTMEFAMQKGYKTIIRDCMNEFSYAMCLQTGFQPVGKISYKEFTLKKGVKPFSDIYGSIYAIRMAKERKGE